MTGFLSHAKNQNNSNKVRFFNAGKALYHLILLFIYKIQGLFCNIALCNSSWTFNHVKRNWGYTTNCKVLYPPCNVDEFWYEDTTQKEQIMVSFAQFRPEKRHDLQLDIWKKLHAYLKPLGINLKFKIIGSCKDESSQIIVDGLLERIATEKIPNVEILKNISFTRVREEFSKASIGVHFMIDEHFGISIVELLVSSLIF